MAVKIKRVVTGDEHLDQKWLVLEGVDEDTGVTKRRSINTAALVSGDVALRDELAQLTKDVEEYAGRHLAVQDALSALE